MALNFEQKCAATMIKNSHFLYHFLQTFHQWNPNQLYHIYQNRKIPNYLSKNMDIAQTQSLLDHCCIAWLDQPIMYFSIDALEGEKFFQDFLSWMDNVSNKKVLEYAHKIKNKSDPQENLLWFTQKSFQSLQAWIVNQFQKVITKNYYNKSNYDLDNYSKIQKLRSGLTNAWSSSFGCKKELDKLLCCKIEETKNKNEIDFKEFQNKVKIYQDQFYEQVSLLIDYEKAEQTEPNNDKVLKKKKKKSKRKNKKKQSQITNDGQNQNNEEELETKEDEKLDNCQKQVEQAPNREDDNAQQGQNQENVRNYDQNSQQKQIQKSMNEQKLRKENSVQKIEKRSKSKSGNSGDSADWSNAQTTKTSKKSGQSQPQFNQIDRKKSLKHKRSLSPEEKSNSISKLKRKHKGYRKNKLTAISSWNGDESLTQNYLESYEGNQFSTHLCENQPTQKYLSEDPSDSKQNQSQSPQPFQQNQKKKKRKNNKSSNILKELSSKIGSSLINRQLNNFIDSLSIQTNSLYDHKIVSFERIRHFIQSIFPTAQALLFGSNAVGLSLPTSDIDIILFNLPCSCREEAMQILAHLAVQINTMGWIVSCSTYLNAKVPLVKLEIDPTVQYFKTKRKCDIIYNPMLDPRLIQHLQLKSKKQKDQRNYLPASQQLQESKEGAINQIIKVDLTVNILEEGFLGGQSTQLMKQWMARYPQIHMCILAFKYILAQRGFSSNFKGGIGSYCLFVMIAAYIRQYPQLESLDDGEFFISTLKFYGEDFENQIKSIMLRPLEQTYETQQGQNGTKRSCFISLQQTLECIKKQMPYYYQSQDPTLLYNIQLNPLRLFDPINNRIMSGSCHLYPQIKSQFRRIYKQLQEMKKNAEKEIELTVTGNEIPKMLQNKKAMDKWLNKYEARTRVSIKDIFDGGF